jgi:hypothetical protein
MTLFWYLKRMVFSTRNLLMFVTLVAAGIAVYRSHQAVEQDQAQLKRLEDEVHSTESSIRRFEESNWHNDPQMRQAVWDEYEAIRNLRELCELSIPKLADRHGNIEPRGSQVISIKRLPSIRDRKGGPPVVFRVYVPEDCELWLKYGAHGDEDKVPSSPDFESGLLRQLANGDVGPYEKRLPPGHHVISRKNGVITVNSVVLLNATIKSTRSLGGGVLMSNPKMQQMDFQNGELSLWSLISEHMVLQSDDAENDRTKISTNLWLDDTSSGFSDFPGDQ